MSILSASFRYGGLVFSTERELAVRFVDDLRAAESAGVEVLDAWIAVCRHDGLRGGLRTIAEREAGHAALLTERLRDLGAPRDATLPGSVRTQALACYGSAVVTDEEKLAALLVRYPVDAEVVRPIGQIVAQLDDDLETRELLQLIAEGDRATVSWLRAYRGE